jgi:hypothetical protein
MSDVLLTEETTDEHDFPTILLAMLSKQNIRVSAVPSVGMNVNLYLEVPISTVCMYALRMGIITKEVTQGRDT